MPYDCTQERDIESRKSEKTMITQTFEKTQIVSSESYQMITDEHLAFLVVAHQILAGSRISLSTYRQVVFSDCIFYATQFQGVTFENCVFENCNFEFSHLRKCKFRNCSFQNCKWIAASVYSTSFEDCVLEAGIESLTYGNRNQVTYKEESQSHTTDIYIEQLLSA
jgi:uncharacterized protein YjbI with pentapeptide repeats